MKKFIIIFVIAIGLYIINILTSAVYCNPLCQDKVIDKSSFRGIYKGFFVPEDGLNRVGIEINKNQDLIYLVSSEENAKSIFGDNVDSEYIISYNLEQFWNEEADECSRIEFLTGGFLVNDLDFLKSIQGKYNNKQGFSGYTEIGAIDIKEGTIDIKINIANKSGSICDFEGRCFIKGKQIICNQDNEGQSIDSNYIGINILQYGIEIFNEPVDLCGIGIRMSGIYMKD